MVDALRRRLLARDPGLPGWAGFIARWTLAVAFFYAGAIKLVAPSKLAEAIANYQLLPASLTPLAAAVMPGIEVTVALALALGFWVRSAAGIALAMMTVFTAAVISALGRGLNIECGCFGGNAPLDWTTLIRDLVLLGLSVLIIVWPGETEAS